MNRSYYISAGEISASSYYVVIQVINKTPRRIVLIPDDNEPAQGFALGPKTISLITKTVRTQQPIIFTAIDAESDGELLINEQTNVSLVPTISKDHIESLTITSGRSNESLNRASDALFNVQQCHPVTIDRNVSFEKCFQYGLFSFFRIG
jgi:hypothetical protein